MGFARYCIKGTDTVAECRLGRIKTNGDMMHHWCTVLFCRLALRDSLPDGSLAAPATWPLLTPCEQRWHDIGTVWPPIYETVVGDHIGPVTFPVDVVAVAVAIECQADSTRRAGTYHWVNHGIPRPQRVFARDE